MDWFIAFQIAVGIAVVSVFPYMLEGKRIYNLLKERMLAKKGYVKAEFLGFNKRRLIKIVKPDDNGHFKSKDGAYFLEEGTEIFDIQKAKFDIEKGEKKIMEGNLPVYTFVAGSSSSHDYYSRDELTRVGTGKQVNQALLSAEGTGEIELLKRLIANKNLLYVLLGILAVIGISAYFSYEAYTILQQLAQRGVTI